MNRSVVTNHNSPIGDMGGEAEMAGGEIAVRSDTDDVANAGGAQADKPSRSRKQSGASPAARSPRKGAKTTSGDVGQMLRGAYRQTVDESIPDDLMDLLNRLE